MAPNDRVQVGSPLDGLCVFYFFWIFGPLWPERLSGPDFYVSAYYFGWAAHLYFSARCIGSAFDDDFPCPPPRLQAVMALVILGCLLPAARLFSGSTAFAPGPRSFEIAMGVIGALSLVLLLSATFLKDKTPYRGTAAAEIGDNDPDSSS